MWYLVRLAFVRRAELSALPGHADAIPIAIRLLNNKQFQPGPFNLGKIGLVIGWIAVGWVVFITAVFIMPTVFPVTRGALQPLRAPVLSASNTPRLYLRASGLSSCSTAWSLRTSQGCGQLTVTSKGFLVMQVHPSRQ